MTTRRIEIEFAAEGTQAASRDVAAFNGAVQNTGAKATAAGASLQGFQQKTSQAGGAVSALGSVLGRTNPMLGGMVSALGQAGTAIGALTTAAGPLGIAIGVISAALAIASTASALFADRTDDAARAAREAHPTLHDLAESYRGVLREQQLLRGGGTLGDTVNELHDAEDAAERLATQIRRLRSAAGQAPSLGMIPRQSPQDLAAGYAMFGAQPDPFARAVEGDDPNSRIGQLIARREAALARASQLRTASETAATDRDTQDAFGGMLAGTGGGSSSVGSAVGGRGAAADPWSEAAINARMGREREFYLQLGALDEAFMAEKAADRDREMAERTENEEALRELGAAIHAEEMERLEETKEKIREEQELQLEKLELLKRAAQEATQQVTDDAMGVLQPVVNGLVKALSSVVAGTESADEAFQGMLASFLEMISQEAALEAAKQFAYAIASFASEDYAGGALHLAAGAAFVGVAVAAGAASVAVAPQAAQPASPQEQTGTQGPTGGTVVINYQAGIYVRGDTAEAGREIDSLVTDGRRRFAA